MWKLQKNDINYTSEVVFICLQVFVNPVTSIVLYYWRVGNVFLAFSISVIVLNDTNDDDDDADGTDWYWWLWCFSSSVKIPCNNTDSCNWYTREGFDRLSVWRLITIFVGFKTIESMAFWSDAYTRYNVVELFWVTVHSLLLLERWLVLALLPEEEVR